MKFLCGLLIGFMTGFATVCAIIANIPDCAKGLGSGVIKLSEVE